MVTRTKVPFAPNNHRITVGSLKSGGTLRPTCSNTSLFTTTGARSSFESNASHSQSNHDTATTSSQRTDTCSSGRRSFKGRNSFRRTLMMRKTNHKKGSLLRSSFESSDERPASPEAREARSSPVTGQHQQSQPITTTPTTTTTLPATAVPVDIPFGHIETVLRVFGHGPSSSDPLDLYRDVLHVSPDATDREVRIAYFRRGREVLSEAGSDGPMSPCLLNEETRSKFQAVSMAYEILSTPEWKEMYLKSGGLIMPQKLRQQDSRERSVDRQQKHPSIAELEEATLEAVSRELFPDTQTQPTPVKTDTRPVSALRSSSFRRDIRKTSMTGKNSTNLQRQSSVRWSEHVEELIFDQDPNEHALDDDNDDQEEDKKDHDDMIRDFLLIGESSNEEPRRQPSIFSFQDRMSPTSESMASTMSSASAKKKKKSKVIIDSDELESHLKRMDNEAERHFVQDFFDTFEESMDGILSLVDSFGETPTKTYQPSKRGMQKNTSDFPKRLFARLGKSMSHDSAEIQGKRQVKTNGRMATSSSVKDDDATFKRSKSFPLPSSEISSSDSNVVDSANTQSKHVPGQSPAMNRNSQASCTPLKPSKSAKTPLSPSALPKPRESPVKQRILLEHSLPGKTTTSPTAFISAQISSPSSVAQNDSFFRPISPSLSEASDVLTTRSDEFDLESLAMSEMENPFRDASFENEKPEPQTRDVSLESKPPQQGEESFDNSTDTKATSHVTTAPSAKPKRENISSVSTVRDWRPKTRKVLAAIGPRLSRGSATGDDVFAGLDEAAQQYSMSQSNDPVGLRGQSISLQRCNSMKSDCVSELSESVFQYSTGGNHPPAMPKLHNRIHPTEQPKAREGANTPASEVSTATTVTSNVASPRRIRFTRSGSSLSTGGDPVSGMDLVSTVSMGDAVSVHFTDSAVEASGFFEYFVAYVSAIVTECNAMGENGQGFHHDILGLFGEEASVHLERREPPSRVMSSGSSVTSMSQP
ncbi:hypothetical protein IV203_033171 [Nitzschia inconspicua]|uniref:J domain-containing protein n=1 Tax=Nitzschia inconspicua TaxID=303405 RepID=A0A9K3PFS2_9STRA|nr:hypothetical protein IV203_033171 [Nitzschia inconspicua]